MQQLISTHLFVRHRLTSVWLERVWDAGFPELEVFCARQHFDYRDKAQVGELGHWFRDSKLKLHSIHAPMYSDNVWGRSGPQSIVNITETSKARRISMVDEIKRAIEVAELIPFRYLIQHVGVQGEEYEERKIDSIFSSLEELKVFAGQRGVEILLENTPNEFSTAERLNALLAQTHLRLNYCFDIGHAHMKGDVAAEFERMKERIRSTHLHDNDGREDQHLFPGKGTVDWKAAMELLTSRGEQFPLMLELREEAEMERPIVEAKKALEELVK